MRANEGAVSDEKAGISGDLEQLAVRSSGATDDPPSCSRPMRADAVKNRRRILEVAEEVFAAEGVSVPIDVVADRAGVGVGTLYRHFPTKETLFEAIVMTRLTDLIETADARADDGDPVEALFSFLREFARQASAKHDLFDALVAAGVDIKSQCTEMIDDLKQRVDLLLQGAVEAGAVRADVSTEEVFGLLIGACQVASHSATGDVSRDRMVDVVCDGLRVPVASLRGT
jgi:AcrR family transcriptional regulator